MESWNGPASSGLPQGVTNPLASQQQLREQIHQMCQQQLQEIHDMQADRQIFKNPELPLTRIKKIMKSDEDVKMIAAEAPVLFAKACEMFILDLTTRSWFQAEQVKRRTLQRSDVAGAVATTDIFDFLVDVVPQEGGQQAEAGTAAAAAAKPGSSALMGSFPYQPVVTSAMAHPNYAGMSQMSMSNPGMTAPLPLQQPPFSSQMHGLLAAQLGQLGHAMPVAQPGMMPQQYQATPQVQGEASPSQLPTQEQKPPG